MPNRRLRTISAWMIGMMFAGLAAATGLQAQAAVSTYIQKRYIIRQVQGVDILCENHRVEQDEDTAGLLRRRGAIAHHDFGEFMVIFRTLNPGATSLQEIPAGRDILIPLKILPQDALPGQNTGQVTLPLLPVGARLQADVLTTITRTVRAGDTVSGLLLQTYGAAYNSPVFQAGLAAFKRLNPLLSDINTIHVGQELNFLTPEALPWDDVAAPPPNGMTNDLQALALQRNARLLEQGIYHFPDATGQTFVLPLTDFPILEDPNRQRIILARGKRLCPATLQIVQRHWPDVRLVSITNEMSLEQLQARLVPPPPASNALSLQDEGVRLKLTFRWQQLQSAAGRGGSERLLLMEVRSKEPATPPELLRYLQTLGLTVRDLYLDPDDRPAPDRPSSYRNMPAVVLDAGTPRLFLRELAGVLQYEFLEDIITNFEYEGFSAAALSNMLVVPRAAPLLVDFGDFQGQTIKTLAQQGVRILQFERSIGSNALLAQLMRALDLDITVNPEFKAVDRPNANNIFITIPGVLLQHTNDLTYLFTSAPLQTHLREYLHNRGIILCQYDPT